jgi:hypothetical protein
MTGRWGSERDRQSRGMSTCRRRVAALGANAGAFLAFGLSPLTAMPAAQADVLTDWVDLIIDPLVNTAPPVEALDFSAWLDPSTSQNLRRERGWDRRDIRTKPFWTPGRSGME